MPLYIVTRKPRRTKDYLKSCAMLVTAMSKSAALRQAAHYEPIYFAALANEPDYCNPVAALAETNKLLIL